MPNTAVDFRSDTVTKPTKQMRAAMAAAEVGDAVFRDDPTVAALEEAACKMFGKEAALFVPTGTMGNSIAVACHTTGRGDEVILGDKSHIFIYEGGGQACLWGNHPHPVANQEDGTMLLADIEGAIRADDPHFPHTALVCIENTQNKCGGRVLPTAHVDSVGALCKARGLKLHMDGARLMNACVVTGESPARMVQACDSLSVCLSKGLGAPVGSVLLGDEAFIHRARRTCKMLGGGWRQAGILAAAALIALTDPAHTHSNLTKDHSNAQRLAQAIESLPGLALSGVVETNVVYFYTHNMSAPEMVEALKERGVLMSAFSDDQCRAACHLDIDLDGVERAIIALTDVTGGAKPPPAQLVNASAAPANHGVGISTSVVPASGYEFPQLFASVVLAFTAGYVLSQRLK